MLRLAVSCSSCSPRRQATDSRSVGEASLLVAERALAPGGEDGRRRGARARLRDRCRPGGCASSRGRDGRRSRPSAGGPGAAHARRWRDSRRPELRRPAAGSGRRAPPAAAPGAGRAAARRARPATTPIASPAPASATRRASVKRARQRHGLDLAIRARDQPAVHAGLARDERRQQRAVRDHVDEARHPAGDAVQEAQRRPREEPRRASAARDREPMVDVGDRLAARERSEMPAQRDALVQLRELGIEEQLAELRLADEHDAQQLLGRRLEVQEQPDLLQQLDRERLRLVEHDDARAPRLALRDQVRVQRVHQIGLALARRREARTRDMIRRSSSSADSGGLRM